MAEEEESLLQCLAFAIREPVIFCIQISHYVSHASLELAVLLPQPLSCWGRRSVCHTRLGLCVFKEVFIQLLRILPSFHFT